MPEKELENELSEEKTDEVLAEAASLREKFSELRKEVARFIVGQETVIEQLVIAVLARGHCLLEGVPGVAKTSMIQSLARTMELSFHRIQFTPDLMPADITGTEIIQENPQTGRRELVFQKGPIFAQMVLADEINRTPPKTQAALLEAMQEHAVTVGNQTWPLEEPFFVLATQNPIEHEGTYPLPEAQRDRFMFHVKVTYPSREEEREIIRRTTGIEELELARVLTVEELLRFQKVVRCVPVPDHVVDFVLDLVRGCRPHEDEVIPEVRELIEWGPGPRASQVLIIGGKVRALLYGRSYVTIEDIEALALPALRHRLVPTFNAEAEGVSVDEIIDQVLSVVPRHDEVNVL